MRTTLRLDDRLMRDAKRAAVERGTTLTRVIEQALQAHLRPAPLRNKKFVYRPVVVGGKEPPAVDITDRKALYDFFDRNP